MKFNQNINRNSQYPKVKDLRTKKNGVGQCISYILAMTAIALSKVNTSKLSKIKLHNSSKYKTEQFRSKKVIDPFFVFTTVVNDVQNKFYLTNSSNLYDLVI